MAKDTPRARAAAPGAETASPGLRERKAAATRLAIVEALKERLGSTPLADISAEDLAADANVSRMTFFNYFPTKEHAVDYLMLTWFHEIECALTANGLRGVAAIQHVFAMMGDDVADAPNRLRRVHAHFAGRPADRPFPTLGRAERAILAGRAGVPPVDEGQPLGLGALLMRSIDEARQDGELEIVGSSYEIAHYLGALANGATLVGQSSPDTDWRRLFRRHAARALGLLNPKNGKGPAPPRIPARYKKQKKGDSQ